MTYVTMVTLLRTVLTSTLEHKYPLFFFGGGGSCNEDYGVFWGGYDRDAHILGNARMFKLKPLFPLLQLG